MYRCTDYWQCLTKNYKYNMHSRFIPYGLLVCIKIAYSTRRVISNCLR